MSGIYVVDLQLERDTGKEPWSQPFAVHVDPDEGQLSYAAHEEVRQALGLDGVLTGLPTKTSTGDNDPGASELGPSLLLALLLLVLGEAAMARYVSVRRT